MAVNNECRNAQEISDTVIAGCNMGQIHPQGQRRSNQITHPHSSIGSQINLALLTAYLKEESKKKIKKKEGRAKRR